jgi:type IV fimbrial biogenesis protein FimT
MALPATRSGLQKGFTLIEALVVLSIFGLLTTIALPSFAEFSRSQRIRAVGFDLVGDLLLARSEAIKRATVVRVAGADTDWSAGWQVEVAGGADDGMVLQQRAAPGNGVGLVDAPVTITFDRNGRLAGAGVVRFGIADLAGNQVKRCIVIGLSGMPQSNPGVCA